MALPIRTILWAGNDSNHHDHLHVEGLPRKTGTPPLTNPGMTDSVEEIYTALVQKFGRPAYMSGGDWTHMGWYNRRRIAGTTIWSQHAWSNALDIGPYYGVAEQQKFYDFLTGKEDDMATITRPSWISDQVLQRLAAQNIVPRERETEDMWRFLAFLDRHGTSQPSGGDLKPGTKFTAVVQ